MLEPYRMVVVNIIASAVLLIGLFVYKRLFPKKKINLFILLLIISFLPLISVFRKGAYESGDLTFHVKFAMQYYENLTQGNIIPAWLEMSCSGYGCPGFIFVYLFSNFLTSVFHFFGFSFIASSKILLILSFVISGIGMFLWMKNEFGEKAGFAAAIFYLFAPYHLIDLHFRVSIAELISMAILPFLFLTTKLLIEAKSHRYFIFTAVLFATLILTHQVTSLATFPLFLIYGFVVWRRNKKKKIFDFLFMLFSFVCGILLTTFYWFPSFMESKYTLWSVGKAITFHPIHEFFYSPGRFGLLFQGNQGEIYTTIGYTQWFVVLLGVYILWKKKIAGKEKTMLVLSLSFFFFLFLMAQSFTKPIWENVPVIINFQFAWRLLIQIILFIAVIAAIVVRTYTNKIFFFVLCFVTIGYTILNWGNRGTLPGVSDMTLRNQLIFPENPGNVDVLTPIWVDIHKPWIGKMPEKHIEVLSGNAEIREVSRLMIKHEYIISAKTKTQFKENTNYFPGWKVFVNNKEVQIDYKNKKYPGIITFAIDEGLHKVDVVFTDTTPRIIGKWISGITALLLLIYSISVINIPAILARLHKLLPKR